MFETYSRRFFANIDGGSRMSATTVLSLLKGYFVPRSMVDVGCGAGSWLRSAQQVFEIDDENLAGVDGVYSKTFHRDLNFGFTYADLSMPVASDRSFELAISLEVAEHLPARRAPTFVDDICRLSNVVLFSAAIPGQGGTGHVNEQWPDYWQREFARNDYMMFDPIRSEVWNDARVGAWYAQNCFVFVHRSEEDLLHKLAGTAVVTNDWRLRLVHPGIYGLAACETAGLSRILKALPSRIAATLTRRLAEVGRTS